VQTCTVEEAAGRLGMGKNSAYAMVRSGRFPVPVLRFGPQGRNIKVPIKGLDDLLGPLPAESANMAVR
jgi:hypothetical protein